MRFKLEFDATSIHIDFKTAYGEQAPSYKTVLRWINRFKDDDDPRAGRPQTGLTEANIELVRNVCIDQYLKIRIKCHVQVSSPIWQSIDWQIKADEPPN